MRTLVRFDYGRLGWADKGLRRRYLTKATGLSRAQVTRLIGQHAATGWIEDRRGKVPAMGAMESRRSCPRLFGGGGGGGVQINRGNAATEIRFEHVHSPKALSKGCASYRPVPK